MDDDTVALSVPVGVASLYLVPATALPPDLAGAAEEVARQLPGMLRRMVLPMLSQAWLTVDAVPNGAVPNGATADGEVSNGPVPAQLVPRGMLAAFGATDSDLDEFESSPYLLRVRGIGKPWWQPYHEWAARAVAAGLAEALPDRGDISGEMGGGPGVSPRSRRPGERHIVDAFTPRLITVEEARRCLPASDRTASDGRVALTDWVLVAQSRGERGHRCTTRGLRRYGLPELRSTDVPSFLVEPWTDALYGIALRLIDEWRTVLTAQDRPSFVEIPAVLPVTEEDVARALGTPPRGGGSALVKLRLDPPENPEDDAFITVIAPDTYPSSLGEYLTEVCTALFGHADSDVRRVTRSDAMDAAIATARARLAQARQTFLDAKLDLDASLLVKHRLSTDDASGKATDASGDATDDPGDASGKATDYATEYVWASVTDWSRPELLVGTSMNDAELDSSVRVGRPVRVSVDAVVDWAIWKEGEGIVEGGWTDRLIEP